MEALVTDQLIRIISFFHHVTLDKRQAFELSFPNTTSYLYNFSLALNQSSLESDKYFQEFNEYGYPSDAFAIHFVRNHPYFCMLIQIGTVLTLVCLIGLGWSLWYFNVYEERVNEQSQEYKELMSKIQRRVDQMKQEEEELKRMMAPQNKEQPESKKKK